MYDAYCLGVYRSYSYDKKIFAHRGSFQSTKALVSTKNATTCVVDEIHVWRRSRVTNIARPEVLKADTKLKHSLILCILGIESTKPFLHIRPLVLPKVWTVIPRMDGLQLVDGFVVVLVVVFGSNYGCLEMWTSVASLVGSFSSPSYFLFVLIAILYISCFVSWG